MPTRGVGRKTAERIVLELRDRLAGLSGAEEPSAPPAEGERLRADLVSALLNLGYHRPPAEKAVDGVLAEGDELAFEDALRQALRSLTR